METKSIVQMAVAVLVAVISVTFILVPAIATAEDTLSETYSNSDSANYIYRASNADSLTRTITMQKDPVTNVWDISGIDFSQTSGDGDSALIFTENATFVISHRYGASICVNTEDHVSYTLADASWDGTAVNITSWNIEITPGLITVTCSLPDHSVESPYNDITYSDNHGDHLIFYGNRAATVYVQNISDVKSMDFTTQKVATYTSGTEVHCWYAGSEVTTESVNYSLTPVEDRSDLFTMQIGPDGFGSDVVVNSLSLTIHPLMLSVPLKYVYTEHKAELSLLNVIPILAVVGIVIGIASVVWTRYD